MAYYSYWFKRLFLYNTFTRTRQRKIIFKIATYNNSQHVKKYQWRALSQGMLNSPTLSQYFVQKPLKQICNKFPQSIIYHYMEDILLADSNMIPLKKMFEEMKKISCLEITKFSRKMQRGDSINYLGYKINPQKIRSQKTQIRRNRLQTLNDLV